jgi:hypothetical protein
MKEFIIRRSWFWGDSDGCFHLYEYQLTRKQWASYKMASVLSWFFGGTSADYMTDELEEIVCGMRLDSEPWRYRLVSEK